LHHTRYHIQTA